MDLDPVTLCVVGLIVLVVALIYYKNTSEKFGTVLGAAGPYARHLNECLNQCNRSDPSRRMLATGNINCDRYCQAVIDEMVSQDVDPRSIPITTSQSQCEASCSKSMRKMLAEGGDTHISPRAAHLAERKCVSTCTGQSEVAKWCKELWCPYSKFPGDDCMNWCVATHTTNNNSFSDWTWDFQK